jgi:hypothetical protein
MKWFGKRGVAFFDVWTIVHLAFWIVVGAVFVMSGLAHKWWIWPLVVGGAYVWEFVEVAMEHFWPNRVLTWEGKVNRWISDPIMAIVGTAFAIGLLTYM